MIINTEWVTGLLVTLFCFTDLIFKCVLIYLIINVRVSIDTITLLAKYIITSKGDNEQ